MANLKGIDVCGQQQRSEEHRTDRDGAIPRNTCGDTDVVMRKMMMMDEDEYHEDYEDDG